MSKRVLHASGLVIMVVIASAGVASAQPSVAVFAQAGYGTFSGGDAKKYNEGVLESLKPVPAKLISNYPPYLIYSAKVSLLFGDRDMMMSFYVGHTSTGSRVSYVDYSGFIYFDQRVVTNAIGSEVAVPFVQEKNWEVFGGIRYTTNFNRVEFDTKLQTPLNYDHVALSFRNITHGFQPTAYVMRKLEFLTISFELGYQYEIPQKLFLAEDRDVHLVDDNNNAVKYNGSGLRAQLGIGVRLSGRE